MDEFGSQIRSFKTYLLDRQHTPIELPREPNQRGAVSSLSLLSDNRRYKQIGPNRDEPPYQLALYA